MPGGIREAGLQDTAELHPQALTPPPRAHPRPGVLPGQPFLEETVTQEASPPGPPPRRPSGPHQDTVRGMLAGGAAQSRGLDEHEFNIQI